MIIRKYKVFNDNFSSDFMINLIDLIEENTLRPDQQLTSEASDSLQNDLFFIESGKLIVYADEQAKKVVKIIEKGECFGEIAFFSG